MPVGIRPTMGHDATRGTSHQNDTIWRDQQHYGMLNFATVPMFFVSSVVYLLAASNSM